jgi:predicted PolB exonuclease-like 3'-5' exonuclease
MSTSPQQAPAYLILDTESVPDGVLLSRTKYAGQELSPEAAIEKAQAEAREASSSGSDFLPVTFHVPICVCIAKVGADFRLQTLGCLDAPQFRPAEITRGFWKGLQHYKARLVTFNGRCFDLPLMELAAFRYGVSVPSYFANKSSMRYRYGDMHIDLLDFLSNHGAIRLAGGLNLLSKLLGKPGKVEASGDKVYEMYRRGELQAINDYCNFDVLDTYFVFLRTRVMTGELSLDQEQALVGEAKTWLQQRSAEQPFLQRYLDRWGDWAPWP